MQVSFNQVKAITDTLPIGLYAERRIDTELKKGEETSWYNPEQDIVVISYEQLINGLDKVNSEQDMEMIIRSNFYHEISHAILTPKLMYPNAVINIFEDERIETVLNNFFFGTDFKRAVKLLADYEPNHLPQDSIEAFFYLVRFRECNEQSFLVRVEQIIKEYATLNRNSQYHSSYTRKVIELYNDLCRACQQRGIKAMFMPNQMQNENGKDEGKGENEGENKDMPKGQGIPKENAKADTKQIESPLPINSIINLLSDSLNSEFNGDFHKALSIIFENFRKKNSKGSCLNGYSGVINPRQADRLDYRFFERSTSARGNNQFGTFHLNLFIDVSGSFQGNQQATNQLIKTLILLEKSNPNFTFDVVATNTHSKILPKGHRFIQCVGGTYLGKDIEDIYRKLQKPQTYNYNIILFDGDAYCSSPSTPKNRYAQMGMGFRTFANNNCTIISDSDNKCYIDQYAPSTKTIYTNNYCEELLDNILKVMQRALS